MAQKADTTSFLTIPPEVARQLAACEAELVTCRDSLDMQTLASTSGAERGRDDAHLDTAQLYVDVSQYVQALVRIACLSEGRTGDSLAATVKSLQDRVDTARGRHERRTKAKRRQLTLGIEDANKVIAAVSKSKRAQTSKPVGVDADKIKPSKKGRGSMEKHRTMGFLEDLKKPT